MAMAKLDRIPSRSPGVTEVAKQAGVSIATVSRVVNQPELVAPATLERVRKVMHELHFRVNPAASALRRGDFKTVSVVVASLSQPWYAELTRSIRVELRKLGYGIIVVDLEHDLNGLEQYLNNTTGHGSSGIIVSTGDYIDAPGTRAALEMTRERMPVVVAGQHLSDATWPTVQYADREGAREATRHLLDVSGGPVAFLGRIHNSYHGAERQAGFEDALLERDIDPAGWIWEIGGVHYGAGHAATAAALSRGIRPLAILGVNDEVALGAMRALHEAGLSVPGDVRVVGFGDTPFASYLAPSLSSVHGSVEQIASLACTALVQMFIGEDERGVTLVQRRLVVRESSE